MIYIVLILALALTAAVVLIYIYNSNNRKIIKELKDINEFEFSNYKVQNIYSLKSYDKLNKEINRILDKSISDRIHFNKKTKAYQEEVLNISHDLRTPLTSMKGYLQITEEKYALGEDITEYLKIIDNKVEVLNNLVETFYEISQIETDEYDYKPESIDINELITDTMLAFYGDFELKNLEVNLNLAENLPVITLDKKLMTRVLTNIIQNILKYGKSFAHVSSVTSEDKLTLIFSNDVKDSDFIKDGLEKIFERSYTADTSRTEGSLGLGLVIAKKLVEIQSGEIIADLNEDEFTIKIEFEL